MEKFESHLTTPEPLELERHFANAVSSGIRYLTMEVSSQALKYDRVMNVEFAAAVLPEHRHGPHFAHRAPGF